VTRVRVRNTTGARIYVSGQALGVGEAKEIERDEAVEELLASGALRAVDPPKTEQRKTEEE
jgi:hypothetical protein